MGINNPYLIWNNETKFVEKKEKFKRDKKSERWKLFPLPHLCCLLCQNKSVFYVETFLIGVHENQEFVRNEVCFLFHEWKSLKVINVKKWIWMWTLFFNVIFMSLITRNKKVWNRRKKKWKILWIGRIPCGSLCCLNVVRKNQ